MAERNYKCKKCGKALPKPQLYRRRPYCSQECFNDARYGDRTCYGNIEARNPLVIAAAKLIQSGLTQKETAKCLGIPPGLVTDWVERYGAEKFYADRICQYCGKSLAGMSSISSRKYCSKSCGEKARYARTHQLTGRQRMDFDPALRANALELYWSGLGQAAIAQHLGVARGTVDSWVNRFGDLRERQPTEEILRLRPSDERLRSTDSAEDWLEALRELTPENPCAEKTVRLSCGSIRGNCSVNRLVTMIMEHLRLDPLSGETFAFCDTNSRTIFTVFWDGEMFRIGIYPKTKGSFVWPRDEFGLLIEIREAEFETMLFHRKKRGRMGKNP